MAEDKDTSGADRGRCLAGCGRQIVQQFDPYCGRECEQYMEELNNSFELTSDTLSPDGTKRTRVYEPKARRRW